VKSCTRQCRIKRRANEEKRVQKVINDRAKLVLKEKKMMLKAEKAREKAEFLCMRLHDKPKSKGNRTQRKNSPVYAIVKAEKGAEYADI
jgi:hypothetical protein